MALARSLDLPPDGHRDRCGDDPTAWAESNAALVRQRRLAEIDSDHIAEELEDLGKSERWALASHLRNLMRHLLKREFQPSRRRPSWQRSIYDARRETALILADSPSLAGRVPGLITQEYPSARRLAAMETGLSEERFPDPCPYPPEQVVDEVYWPGGV